MINPDESVLAAGTRVDQYVVAGLLGRGGFGITYLVRDETLRREFALKEFFPEGLVMREGTSVRFAARANSESDYRWGLKKFYDEARLLAQFNHANIVSVRRVFEANNCAYMLLDFIRGRTLETWLQGLDSPPTQEELDLISQPLLSALELVHANRTWHLDISPDNVMIRAADGAPILLDFGASRFELKQHSQLVSALVFKTGYSAPEQYTSNAERYGPWTDIYAFAATLYRAISGSRLPDATARQLGDEETPATLVGKGRYRREFLQAIDWALSIPPRARPQSIGEWRGPLLRGNGAVAVRATADRPTDGRLAAPIPAPTPVPEARAVPAAPVRTGVSVWMLLVSIIASLGVGAGASYIVQEELRKAQVARSGSEKTVEQKRTAAAAPRRLQKLFNTALVGEVIALESQPTADACLARCSARDGCKAYEYRPTGGHCYLYRRVTEQLVSSEAISGRWD